MVSTLPESVAANKLEAIPLSNNTAARGKTETIKDIKEQILKPQD